MKRLLMLWLVLASVLLVNALEIESIPNVHLSDSTRYVSDPERVLSPEAVRAIDASLDSLRLAGIAEPAVVLIEHLPEDSDIDTFATELFNRWGIGNKQTDNGILMVVARADRKAAIRTGRGMEGPLPDITCGRILRHDVFPRFREEDYDGGVLAAVRAISRVISDPEYAAELRAPQSFLDNQEEDFTGLFTGLLAYAAIAALLLLAYVLWKLHSTRHLDVVTRYERLQSALLPVWVIGAFTLGFGLPAGFIMWRSMKRMRSHHRHCPNCSHAMQKLNEEADNAYLTPAQDTEERIGSVDYDVWLCPQCNEIDILPFVTSGTRYTKCPVCHARAREMTSNRVVQQPSHLHSGRGVRTFICRNCGNLHEEPYNIAKTAPPVIVPGGGRGFGGGGGGFGGGSFGGGMSIGGGASGGW